MPSPRLIVSRKAKADLFDIWTYLAQRNPSAADHLLRKLGESSETLSSYPSLGIQRVDLGDGMRKWTVDNYLILYRIIEGGIEVIRYLDARRDLKSVFK